MWHIVYKKFPSLCTLYYVLNCICSFLSMLFMKMLDIDLNSSWHLFCFGKLLNWHLCMYIQLFLFSSFIMVIILETLFTTISHVILHDYVAFPFILSIFHVLTQFSLHCILLWCRFWCLCSDPSLVWLLLFGESSMFWDFMNSVSDFFFSLWSLDFDGSLVLVPTD